MFVIAMRYAQLGNRLFLFAHIIACAIENKVKVMNLAFSEYADFFETTSKDFFCRYPAKKSLLKRNKILGILFYYLTFFASTVILVLSQIVKNIFIKTIYLPSRCGAMAELRLDSPDFLNFLRAKQIIFLMGWRFRDRTNIMKHADKIRAYFKPREKYLSNVTALINKSRKNCDILVGVHIRQGDVRNPKSFGHNMGWHHETDTYVKVMERIEKLFHGKRVGFLISSDEKQDGGKFSKFNFTFGTGHIIEDMYSLAQCDYIAGPPSTYSGWASFYGDVPQYVIFDSNATISLEKFNKATWREQI